MSKEPFIEQLDQALVRLFADPDALPLSVDPEIGGLLRLAPVLRGLPRPDFKANLKADLERKAIMMSATTATLRPGFRTITPYLLPRSLEFIDFVKSVFGAEETLRGQAGPDRYHVELRIGDSMLMVGVGADRRMPATLNVYVPDVDDVYKRAIDAGCVELESLQDAHWEPLRLGVVEDREGNVWVLASHLGPNHIPEGLSSLCAGFIVKDAPRFIDFLKQAFHAQEHKRWEWPGGLYVSLRIGDSVVGVSESSNDEWMRPMTAMINMYVPDCDALYEEALRAGATSIVPVADQPYGVRSGAVQDAWGNQWFIGTPFRTTT